MFWLITVVLFWLALIAGWIMNLVEVIHLATSGAIVDALFITRIVGVPIAVIGGILGWF